MGVSRSALVRVFEALGDPTRLAVVERLSRGPASVSELASNHEMALPSFLQHLRTLEAAGLVRSRKNGRVRTYRLSPIKLGRAERWLEQQRRLWNQRLDQLDAYLLEMKEKDNG